MPYPGAKSPLELVAVMIPSIDEAVRIECPGHIFAAAAP
jgi:hypothetical protein